MFVFLDTPLTIVSLVVLTLFFVSVFCDDEENTEAEQAKPEEAAKPVRTMEKMKKKFQKWSKENPKLRNVFSIIFSQIEDLETNCKVYEEVVRDSEHGKKGEESRKVFYDTVEEIRQNFSDVYNLLLLAGVKRGGATEEDLSKDHLAMEFDSTAKKLRLLRELNEQVIYLVNQTDSTTENAAIEGENKVLSSINDLRYAAGRARQAVSDGGSQLMEAVVAAREAVEQVYATDHTINSTVNHVANRTATAPASQPAKRPSAVRKMGGTHISTKRPKF